ncbi:hypothetical protein PPGU16_36220 [Paraburkholderia largidicola]|uniref:Uncharacterized protein n=1 Tax=Paraburkholderia largidicola TaxID=3014751 RepID=A0A7I8BQ07_9BURK|nr:hypothetical protein PPGU16_36220 [Paraburkholderia sp. PGU16]
MLHTATSLLVPVANASNERLTRFEYPYSGQRQRLACAAKVANCVQVVAPQRVALLSETPTVLHSPECGAYGAKAYTQFATCAAVGYLARRAETRVREVGEAYRENVGNEREPGRCRLKRKTLRGPSGKH